MYMCVFTCMCVKGHILNTLFLTGQTQSLIPVEPEGPRDEAGTITVVLTPCGKKNPIKISVP